MEEDDVLYLFVIHGGNVSAKRDYLGYKTKTFRNIFMYAKPHMPLNTGQLLPTKFMNVRHSLWKIPDDEDSNFNIIYIPPLLYTLENDPELNPILGLYKFIGNNEPVKLRDYDNLKSLVDGNVKQPITISDMEGYVLEDVNQNKHIKPNIGVFSCQTPTYYDPVVQPSTVQLKDGVPKINYLDFNFFKRLSAEEQQSASYAVTITPVLTPPPQNWKALAQQTNKGCGLNVLSFLGIIPESDARSQVCALNNKGTSIFTLYDHYYNKYKSTIQDITYGDKTSSPFFIIRTTMIDAVRLMIEVLSQHIDQNYGYGIMFKMYQHKQSEKGHSVLFFKDKVGSVYFIDPQNSILEQVNAAATIDSIVLSLNNLYRGAFTELELCFTVRENMKNEGGIQPSFPVTRIPRLLDDNTGIIAQILSASTNSYQLRTRNTFVTYSGGKNKKMSKRKCKIKSQIKYKPKRKTEKIYQQGGSISEERAYNTFLELASKDPNIDTKNTMLASVMQDMNG